MGIWVALPPLPLGHAAANSLAQMPWPRLYQGQLKGTVAGSRKNYSLDPQRSTGAETAGDKSPPSVVLSPLQQVPLLGVLFEQPRQVRVWRPEKRTERGGVKAGAAYHCRLCHWLLCDSEPRSPHLLNGKAIPPAASGGGRWQCVSAARTEIRGLQSQGFEVSSLSLWLSLLL